MGRGWAVKIGVFSKFDMAGGSEFRCAELASGLARYSPHDAHLLCEKELPGRVCEKVREGVTVRTNVMQDKRRAAILYDMDVTVVVNTDSKVFTDVDYWRGQTTRHSSAVDLSRLGRLVFLFNFIVSPSIKLAALLPEVPDIRVITTNRRFFDEMSTQDRYLPVRHLPRLLLASPIDPDSVSGDKGASDKVRIGQFSVSMEQKFNEEIPDLVHAVNAQYGDRVTWDFMGIPRSRAARIDQCPNVTIREAFSVPVRELLRGMDIFLFYPSWSRQEPWSRAVGEALMNGCPVVATDKGGNSDQVVHGNNGYLCRNLDEFAEHLGRLIEEPELRHAMGTNARLYSRYFSTPYVVAKLLEFIR